MGLSGRIKPTDADNFGWDQFEVWADQDGVGTEPEDVEPWWQCWKTAWTNCWRVCGRI